MKNPDYLYGIYITYEDALALSAMLSKPINIEVNHEDPVDYMVRNNVLKKVNKIIEKARAK